MADGSSLKTLSPLTLALQEIHNASGVPCGGSLDRDELLLWAAFRAPAYLKNMQEFLKKQEEAGVPCIEVPPNRFIVNKRVPPAQVGEGKYVWSNLLAANTLLEPYAEVRFNGQTFVDGRRIIYCGGFSPLDDSNESRDLIAGTFEEYMKKALPEQVMDLLHQYGRLNPKLKEVWCLPSVYRKEGDEGTIYRACYENEGGGKWTKKILPVTQEVVGATLLLR